MVLLLHVEDLVDSSSLWLSSEDAVESRRKLNKWKRERLSCVTCLETLSLTVMVVVLERAEDAFGFSFELSRAIVVTNEVRDRFVCVAFDMKSYETQLLFCRQKARPSPYRP